MPERPTGRGTKQLIGMLVLSASIIGSAFGIGMKIQKLIDALDSVRRDHIEIQGEIKALQGQLKK